MTPTVSPRGAPSVVPFIEPSLFSTLKPTKSPSRMIANSPTAFPSIVPSVIPSLILSDSPSRNPNNSPTIAPSMVFTFIPTFDPLNNPSVILSIQPTAMKIVSTFPSQSLAIVVPTIVSVHLNSTSTTIVVSVKLSSTGSIACAAYSPEFVLQSADDISRSQLSSSSNNAKISTITIQGLTPITSYIVYCYASKQSAVSTVSEVLKNAQLIRTKCCKIVSVYQSTNVILATKSSLDFLQFSLSSLPSASLGIQLISNSNITSQFFPSTFTFSNVDNPSMLVAYSSLRAQSPGVYSYNILLTGPSASEYNIWYNSGNSNAISLIVLESDQYPPAPRITNVQFSDDISYFTISFDSNTNKGNTNTFSICADLFVFPCANISQCQWVDVQTVRVFINTGNNCAKPGDSLYIAHNTSIKAMCQNTNGLCPSQSEWKNASSVPTIIQSPQNPCIPSVIIVSPTTVGACDNLTLDITCSTGNGGRLWQMVSIIVEGSPGSSAAQLNAFLGRNQKLSIVPSVPYYLIQKGYSYTFRVQLCNFLLKCNEASKLVSAINDSVPLVTILGSGMRTVSRGKLLTVESQVSSSSCSQTVHGLPLSYSWSIWANNSALNIQSISKDSGKFILPAYTLLTKSYYKVLLSVNIIGHTVSATAVSYIYVGFGNVQCIVSGGQYRNMIVGSTIILDASRSYDEDVYGLTGTDTELRFAWSCVQLSPAFNSSCAEYLRVVRWSVSVSVTALPTSTGLYKFTIAVSDKSGSRGSQCIITLQVLPKQSSIVTVSSNIITGLMNPSQNLQLTGSLSLSDISNTTAWWTIDDRSIDIHRIATTPTRIQVSTLVSTTYLVIPPNSFPGGVKLTFVLACRSAIDTEATISYITIVTNAAPRPGFFTVSPTSGAELQTVFTLTALQWIDSELPLSYQFGYLSPSSYYITIQSRSAATFGSSKLPTAVEGLLSTFLRVFDALDSNTTSLSTVAITESNTVSSPSNILQFLKAGMNASRSVDDIYRATVFSTHLLNKVNCSQVVNCSFLHRHACYKTAHTCGSCYGNYLGEIGDSNSPCYPSHELEMTTVYRSGTSCVSGGCPAFQHCIAGKCQKTMKACAYNCSSHGKCDFFTVDSGTSLTTCFTGDSTCTARCTCDKEYLGSQSCDVTAVGFSIKQTVRYQIIQNIIRLVGIQYPQTDSVNGMIAALADATQNAQELSDLSVAAVLNISESIIHTAASLQLSNAAMSIILSSINSATQQLTMLRNISVSSSSINSSIYNLQLYNSIISGNILPGENAVQEIHSEFRLKVSSLQDITSLSLPIDLLEQVNRIEPSRVLLSPSISASSTASLIMLRSELYSNSYYRSNPILTDFSSWPCDNSSCSLQFVLQNSVPIRSYKNLTYEPFNINCRSGHPYVVSFKCSSGFIVYKNCTGNFQVFHGKCPPQRASASCAIGSSGRWTPVCQLVDFTATNTTCSCTFSSAAVAHRRLAGDGNGSYSISIVNMLELVTSGMESTILSAQDLNATNAAKQWSVLAALGGLTFVILACMLFGHIYDVKDTKAINAKRSTHKAIISKNMIANSAKARAARFYSLVPTPVLKGPRQERSPLSIMEEALPHVLSHQKTMLQKIIHEISHHHRWVAVFSLYSETFPRSLRVLSLATNIIVMLFIQSITYNLSNPDDGTCRTFTDEKACTRSKSSFSNGSNKCRWVQGSSNARSCIFIEPSDSSNIVIFVAMFSAVVSAPIVVFLHALIKSLLAAPTRTEDDPDTTTSNNSYLSSIRSVLFAVRPESEHDREVEEDLNHLMQRIAVYRDTLPDSERVVFDGTFLSIYK